MAIDRKQFYTDLELEFKDPSHSTEVNILAKECLKYGEEWLSLQKDTESKTRRELRKDLKTHIVSQVDLQDQSKAYYIPSFIWMFIAGQVISWVVRYLIRKYTNGQGD
jgi:hypothetical protein